MDGHEFYEQIDKHPALEWLGVIEGHSPAEDEVLIQHAEVGIKHALTIRTVLETPWKELEAVLTGKREPRIMIHLTRIVGYYSRVQNWNRSKLAELKDRHNGNYGLQAEQPKKRKKIMVPGVVGRKKVGAKQAPRALVQ